MDTTQIWQSLEHLVKNPSDLNTLFESDFDRGDRFGVSACDIYMDFSKH